MDMEAGTRECSIQIGKVHYAYLSSLVRCTENRFPHHDLGLDDVLQLGLGSFEYFTSEHGQLLERPAHEYGRL